ncbi:hypothetical protein ACOT81_36235 [Streptomyces sp. WI04-05B]|uniref:hypothetical protein n=1 Tax=Streptomyces TaxID=1883 RepID=UPI0029B9E392|nr:MULTISPECIES: hypothetical protein [unclassified Streptomyces]MDX2546341.1 hypothetical protein [Streptomyces sp. WI04-05B]MDX2589206.1 hypothetical protein [Streptomyces sp. WI04-05A]
MSPVRRAVRPALLLSSALLLGACGIPTTGVVGSGQPATGARSTVTLYFPGKGGLIAVSRRIPQRPGVEAAMWLLFQGPTSAEQREGLASRLPSLRSNRTLRVADGARVSIELGFDSRRDFANIAKSMSPDALAQLACTAVSARHAEDPKVESVEVLLTATAQDSEDRWNVEGHRATCSRAGRGSATDSPSRTGASLP